MFKSIATFRAVPIVVITILGMFLTGIIANQTVNVSDINIDSDTMSLDEEAYYEFVTPRLEVIVTEVNTTVELVSTKSRNLPKLTKAGNTIETLTGEIKEYGETHGVPPRFADVHQRILSASDTANYTFGEARKALFSGNFRKMTDLVDSFNAAAVEFNIAFAEIKVAAGV